MAKTKKKKRNKRTPQQLEKNASKTERGNGEKYS